MRKSCEPTPVKGSKSKMLPMGPLGCYSRERIKVERKWTREVGEGGVYVGGFIDDVENGERLLVDRPLKEFEYWTLRLKVCFRKMYHSISHCFAGSGPIGVPKEVTSLKARNFLR